MPKINRSKSFITDLNIIISENKELSPLINERIKLFKKNPDDTRLTNHPLRKGMKGKYAFSITDDIRVIYDWIGNNTIRFLAIDSHEEVYGREYN